MRKVRLLFEAGIMAGGLTLVLITLSGTTRDVGVVVSVASVALFLAAGLIEEDDIDEN